MSSAAPSAIHAALLEALAATPELPSGDLDSIEILAIGERMVTARQLPFANLAKLLAAAPKLSAEEVALLDAIRGRDARWMALLNRARHEISDRLVAFNRMKQYGRRAG